MELLADALKPSELLNRAINVPIDCHSIGRNVKSTLGLH